MSLVDLLISKFAPYTCLGCGQEGKLLCPTCTGSLTLIPSRCYRCRTVTPASHTCATCRKSSKLHAVHVVSVYGGLAKDLTWRLKFKGAQGAAAEMAYLMNSVLPAYLPSALLVPVPTATSRARRRGYDQAKLLARELSRRTQFTYRECLVRGGQAHQVGASRYQRLQQLSGAFRVSKQKVVRGAHILLVDDVLTTGATLEAAATACRAAGARRVEAVVFAQA